MVVDRVGDQRVARGPMLVRQSESRRKHLAARDAAMELQSRSDRPVHADRIVLGRATNDPDDQGGWGEIGVNG